MLVLATSETMSPSKLTSILVVVSSKLTSTLVVALVIMIIVQCNQVIMEVNPEKNHRVFKLFIHIV